jgi:hypothetical protein
VQVIKVAGDVVDTVFRTFWGTHLMNVATHEGVYCPFPKSTLERRQMAVSIEGRISEVKALFKYLGRGFSRVSRDEKSRIEEFAEGRVLSDSLTRRVLYDEGGEWSSPLGNSVVRVQDA